MGFEETSLWKAAFAARGGKAGAAARRRLMAAYEVFWKNACELSRTIQTDLPTLTLHDERHFEALWRRASLLVGRVHKLNPLETFVLGGAILLHDIGHALATYPGRLADVRGTPQWRDNLAIAMRGPNGEPPGNHELANPPERIQAQVLFDTLRSLHAERAKVLGGTAFIHPGARQETYLIEDVGIRIHLGEIIGLIAASHHWDIEQLRLRLPRTLGAISGMPDEWTIDPVYLACVLRCADAIQIDQDRTPDFLYSMLRLHGVSEKHWRAQNRLAAPALDRHDRTLLTFTSTMAFRPEDADAWWLAYEAIALADDEIRQSNVLLGDLGHPRLAVAGIRDAHAPERLASSVRTSAWRPIFATLKISNVQRVVSLFGGEALYGDDHTVPIRELIQNASDAVRARRAMEPLGTSYRGRVVISLLPGENDSAGSIWLNVEDDGIGMSERTLTGPLLDFGISSWGSEFLQSEFPGLVGKNPRQTGRYGIGFFSVFMLADRVVVDLRRFDQGVDQLRSLCFHHGLALRPLLLESPVRPLSPLISTRVSFLLSDERLQKLLLPRNDGIPVAVSFGEMIRRICPMLDCDVFVADPQGTTELAHAERWHEEDAMTWVRQIEIADNPWHQKQTETYRRHLHLLGRQAQYLTVVRSESRVVGRAAIDFCGLRGLRAIGGLLVPNGDSFWYNFDDGYIGCFEQSPSGPRRGPGVIAQDVSLWASEQAVRLENAELSPNERQRAAINVAHHGGDPSPLATAFVDKQLLTLPDIVETFILPGKELIFPIEEAYGRLRLILSFNSITRSKILNENWGMLRFDEADFLPGIAWLPTASSIWGPIERAYYQVPDLNITEVQ